MAKNRARIADASVMPETVARNANAPVARMPDRLEAHAEQEKSLAAISDILSRVRRGLIFVCILIFAGTCALVAAQSSQQSQSPPQTQQQAAPAQPQPQNTAPAQQAPTPPPQTLQTIVLDPAHGGPDTGARGANGVAEKDIVLEFANEAAASLRAEGFKVVLTRQGDTDPSSDDRATIANAESGTIFISLHVASTGPINTVRTYTYLFPATVAAVSSASSRPATPTVAPSGFLMWQEAQKPFVEQSRKLGDLLQVELAQKFKNSPEVSWSAPIYGLRSVTAPAVDVEVSSVAANPQQLEAMATPLAQGIARAVAAYKTIYPPGGR
ncbi:MAG TPA: N-acetylmuramoyl-L-alanine amidase [Candidatus Acidoferrales bacterium]|nr:N-acetylmuramoyl-L-alanine amidase [Candidatus Acidoferrales bacterium]